MSGQKKNWTIKINILHLQEQQQWFSTVGPFLHN